MVTVLFTSESHYPVSREKIIRAIQTSLEKRIRGNCEVSVSIIGDRKMKELNSGYRNKDYATDVLSFPQHDPAQPQTAPFVEPPDNVMRLGDIVISYPQAVLEAAADNKLVDDVVEFLALHGLEHLLGNHHPEE
jgi:probable rRNA maturation factor